MKILGLVGCLILLFKIDSLSQDVKPLDYPEVGKPMPEITFSNIMYYSKKQANLNDFRGKWLLLDFWNIQCSACIASFPYVNEIQEKLGGRVQVMLIGIQDERRLIEPMYAKFRDRLHFVMPCDFDSVLANRLDIYIAPHSILIDDKGIVQCITTSFCLEDIRGFLEGKPPELGKTYRRMHDTIVVNTGRYSFDDKKPFLIKENGGSDTAFLFRSILSEWNRDLHHQYVPSSINQEANSGRFQVLGVPLEWLYNYAFFGHGYWAYFDTEQYGKDFVHPILEIRDSSRFNYSFKYSKNLYSYSLIMPVTACTKQSMEKALQRDLETYFGFESRIETRNCPCWKLKLKEGMKEKLKTKVKEPYYRQLTLHSGFSAGNYPMQSLLNWVRSNQLEKVIIDDTGITDNIDISLDCIPTDFDDLRNSLCASGFELVRSEIPMNVVVIRDKIDSNSIVK